MKKLLLVIVLTIVFSMFGCRATMNKTGQNEQTHTQAVETGPYYIINNANDALPYKDILVDYEKLISFYLSDSFAVDLENNNIPQWSESLNKAIDEDVLRNWGYMVGTMGYPLTDPQADNFGYILYDINEDTIPELFWVRKDHSILAVFTVVNNKVVLLDAFWNRYACVITGDNCLYTRGSSGATHTVFTTRELSSDGKLATVLSFGVEPYDCDTGFRYFQVIDDERAVIDKEQYNLLRQDNPFEQSQHWLSLNITYFSKTGDGSLVPSEDTESVD